MLAIVDAARVGGKYEARVRPRAGRLESGRTGGLRLSDGWCRAVGRRARVVISQLPSNFPVLSFRRARDAPPLALGRACPSWEGGLVSTCNGPPLGVSTPFLGKGTSPPTFTFSSPDHSSSFARRSRLEGVSWVVVGASQVDSSASFLTLPAPFFTPRRWRARPPPSRSEVRTKRGGDGAVRVTVLKFT